jgi:hypothetical protein
MCYYAQSGLIPVPKTAGAARRKHSACRGIVSIMRFTTSLSLGREVIFIIYFGVKVANLKKIRRQNIHGKSRVKETCS